MGKLVIRGEVVTKDPITELWLERTESGEVCVMSRREGTNQDLYEVVFIPGTELRNPIKRWGVSSSNFLTR